MSSRLRLLIADDEPLIRSGIRHTLAADPGVIVAGECENASETIEFVLSQPVDLLLLDIRLPDASGLDVVREIGPERMPLVIFITAYDEYAVRAFELHALDYLLKPFDDERLLSAVNRARRHFGTHGELQLAEQLRNLLQTKEPQWPARLSVRHRDGFRLVPVETIDWIEAADNYVQLHCAGGVTHLHSETLSSLTQRLDPAQFARIHRCRVVNVSKIVTITPLVNGTFELCLQDGSRLTSGRNHRDTLTKLIER